MKWRSWADAETHTERKDKGGSYILLISPTTFGADVGLGLQGVRHVGTFVLDPIFIFGCS